MIKRNFFTGLSWLLALNVLIKPVWIFAIDLQVQNTVGNKAYGVYFALFGLSYVLLFLADAGLTNMMAQRIAAQQRIGSRQLLKVKCVMLAGYIIVCLVTAWLTDIVAWDIFLRLIALQVFTSFFLFLRGLLTANQFYKTDAFFSVADKALLILLAAVFIYGWLQPITILIFLSLQIFSTVIACLVLLFLLLKQQLLYNGEKEPPGRLVKSLAPFALIMLLMAMHYRLDGFLLERLRPDGAVQAGVYAAAYRLLDAGNTAGYLTASFLVTFVARNKAARKLTETVVSRSAFLLMMIALTAACFTYVFAPWVQQTLYKTAAPLTTTVIQLLVAVLPACYLVHVYGSVLTATGAFTSFISLLVTCVVVNLCLNYIWIPTDGAIGCCKAALVSQYACGMGCYVLAARQAGWNIQLKPLLFYAVAALLLLAFFFFLKTAIGYVWVILAAVVITLTIVLAVQRRPVKRFFSSFIQ